MPEGPSRTGLNRTGDAASRLRDAGKGELLEELRLNGEVELGRDRSSSTSLCRTTMGLFLVLLRANGDDVIDLLAADRRLRYRMQLLGDRLDIDHWMLSVPFRRGEQAQRIIGLARIRRAFGLAGERSVSGRCSEQGAWAWSEPFVEHLGPLARAWLSSWLDTDERLLAWKSTDARHRFDSPVLGPVEAPEVLVITERRQGLVAISPVGDPWSRVLPDAALEVVSSTVGRSMLKADERELLLGLGDEKLFVELAALPGLRGEDRLRAVARALWLRGPDGEHAWRVAAILDELADRDPLSRLARALLDNSEFSDDLLRDLIAKADAKTGRALVEWWEQWEVGPELGEVLVEHLCEQGRAGMELALPLHEQLRPLLLAKVDDDPEDAALLDFVYAEHLLAIDRAQQAIDLLAARRRVLPSEELQDLLPPSPTRGGQQIRIELYELAASAHEMLGGGHVEALAELARLQPLVRERVEQLIMVLRERVLHQRDGDDESSDLLARAEQVRSLLDDEGLATSEPHVHGEAREHRRVRALDDQQLELLRHPAARVDGVLGRLQGALAKVVVPDCSVLKSYCERANLARNPPLSRALTDATVILGLGGIEVFVSRGDKSVGLRAYEGGTSFLLIGGDHVSEGTDAFLDEGPLRFAVAAELAHLRYAHSRVTSNEVWAGTVDLGLTGLGMLIAAAPLLKGLKAPAKHLLDKVGAPAITRWRKKLEGRDTISLANDNTHVIAAQRVMQLSADRAGLLVCGDPRAAIRSMFSVHPTYLSSWPVVGSHGLRTALTRELSDEDEHERLEDLAVRVAALLSFYLSDEYALLRRVILAK